MTQNQIMSAAAIGFAVFALYYISRKPAAGPVASQPGQRQRDAGLVEWFDNLTRQDAQFAGSQQASLYEFKGFF